VNETMKAAVMDAPGGPEVLRIERRAVPTPKDGEVLIRVKAFGLNRSELFTRRGDSPSVTFPRILGIEAVGVVERAPSTSFVAGDVVATAMGGMGREFDGGYAEFTCVPATQVQKIATRLGWDVLGAMPEMMQTAWGSLFTALRLERGDRLLVRGGSTSVGLAASAIARHHGATVAATSRKPERTDLLCASGAEHVVVDTGEIAAAVRDLWTDGATKVLELVGVTTLLDSLNCVATRGIVCVTGAVGTRGSSSASPRPMRFRTASISRTTAAARTTSWRRRFKNSSISSPQARCTCRLVGSSPSTRSWTRIASWRPMRRAARSSS